MRDNGVGIPRGELKRVFKRFYRVLTPGASQVKGSGLGLFIVRAIARRHGGNAYAESEGSGQRHHRYHSVAEELAVNEILLVEDEEHLARGLKFNLEAEGYPTRVVGDGETALDLLLKQRSEFDLLVLDVMLPGKDGFAVASELRKASNYIPLLMLTARGRPEDVLKGFASGADDYLPKPFDLAILLARIRSLLRRRDWGRTLLTDPPAEARVAEPKDADSLREFDVYVFDGKQVDFGTLELRANGQGLPPDADGGRAAAPPHPQQRQDRFAQIDSRRGLGPARGHRHARHRQLHRAAAQVHREGPVASPASADGARRGIPVSAYAGRG